MHIGIPFIAVLIVILTVYLLARFMGISIRFPLLFSCGLIGLFLGLMLPKVLLPQVNLSGTIAIVVLAMAILSFALAFFFGREDINAIDKAEIAAAVVKEQNDEEILFAGDVQTSDLEPIVLNNEVEADPVQETESIEIEPEPTGILANIVKDEIEDNLIHNDISKEKVHLTNNFDSTSIFGDNLHTTQYIPDIKAIKEPEDKPAIVQVNHDIVRNSAYEETFVEEINTASHVEINTTKTNKKNKASVRETTIIDKVNDIFVEQNECVNEMAMENVMQAKPCVQDNISDEAETYLNREDAKPETEQYAENNISKNNLVKFPMQEPQTFYANNPEKNKFNENKVIAFPTKPIEKTDDYWPVQNSDALLPENKGIENISENNNFYNKENITVNSQENNLFDNELTQKQNMLDMVVNEDFSAENFSKVEQEDYPNTITNNIFVEDLEKPDYMSIKHCNDKDLPYQRYIATNSVKKTTMPSIEKEAKRNLLPKQVPKSDSFDDLLDFAFIQKERGNFDDAVLVFEMAYEMYYFMEMASLIIAELVNVYKQLGSYNKAIKLLQRGLENTSAEIIRKDFITNIAYMRIIKNILQTKHLDLLPYDEIPDKVKEEIEKEFSNWKYSS